MRVCMLLHKSVVHDARVRREARTLVEAGHDVTVLELAPVVAGQEVLDGFARRSVTPPPWMRRRLPFQSYRVAFLVAFVAGGVRIRPEVVHAHDAAMLAPGALIARLTGARLVYDSHELATGVAYRSGAWECFVGGLERLLVPRSSAVITVSDGIATRLRERYGLPADPVVLRNVCDLPVPGPQAGPGLRTRLGIGSEPLVLHHGSAADGRGGDILVRAVAGLEGTHLAFLGAAGEPAAESLGALAEREGAGERVHLLPGAPLETLLSDSAEADVGVSLLQDTCENHRLALPNKVFEYLRAGLPFVAADHPEMRRLVTEHGVGRLVAPADPDAVREGLAEMLAADPDRSRMAAAADALSWDRERERLTGLYRALGETDAVATRRRYRAYAADAGCARRWAATNPGNAAIRAELLDQILRDTAAQRMAGTEVLDIGCGGGYWLKQLADRGAVDPALLSGIDLVTERIAAASVRVPGAAVVEGDGERLPWPDARFGIVLLLTVLSSAGGAARRARLLTEAARVLAPGGVLVVYEPRLPNPRNRATRLVRRAELEATGLLAEHRSITVLPALARRASGYDRLARIPVLRTHRLSVLRR